MKPYELIMDSAVKFRRMIKGEHSQTVFTKYLEQIEYKSKEELKQLQAEAMSELLKHTVENVPFYQDMRGQLELSPATVHEDIKQFPILKRDTIINDYEKLIAKNVKGGKRYHTGGTTGTKAIIIRGKSEYLHSTDEYFNRMTGIFPGKSRLWIRRFEDVYFADNPVDKESSYNFISRTSIVSPAYMDMKKLQYLYKVYKTNKPKLILGVTEVIFRFADYIKKNNLKTYPVELVGTGCQTMLPRYRKVIESVFKGAYILDGYGASEFGNMALQCKQSAGYHYVPVVHYIEAVDGNYKDVPMGETGQMLVTNLFKRKMPLIRYQIDDLIRLSDKQCDCGRGFPLIDAFEGRRIESILSPKNTYMTPLPFFKIMDRFTNVDDFLVEQRSDNTVTLILKMKKGEFTKVQRLAVRKELNRYLDYPMKLDIEYTDSIDPMPNGKIMRVRGLESFKNSKK